MKKYLKYILLFCGLLLITGCGCSKKDSDIDIELEKGVVTSVCKKTVVLDGNKIETIETTNYDASKNAMNYKIRATYTFSDIEKYNVNLKEVEDNIPTYQDGATSAFKYKADENNKTITTVFAYLKLELGAELIDEYKAGNRISASESNGFVCEITGADRSDLGLE